MIHIICPQEYYSMISPTRVTYQIHTLYTQTALNDASTEFLIAWLTMYHSLQEKCCIVRDNRTKRR